MSHLTLEDKAAIKANLELELTTRRDKLVAMCETHVASLRSRLERRVNRIPNSKRNMKLIELLDPSVTIPAKAVKAAAAKKEVAPIIEVPPVPVRAAVQPAARKTRAAPAKPAPKPAPKATRGKKRPSDDGDKENEELSVPKKRVKTAVKPAASAPGPTRSTRAASRKVAAPAAQVLSPKPNNSRPAPRTRRPR